MEFKARLERQADRYVFVQFLRNTSFEEDKMLSFTGQTGPNTVVEYTLSPALFKHTPEGPPELVVKGRVKTIQAFQVLILPEAPVARESEWNSQNFATMA